MGPRPLPVRGGPADGELWGGREILRDACHFGEWYVYRRLEDHWAFMGDDAHRCLGCDAIVEVPRADRCPLCGAAGPG